MPQAAPTQTESASGMSRLTWTEKLGYGLGEFGSEMVWGMSITFLLYFYTDVFGISAAAAGTLLMMARICDAMLDPVMGMITERVTTRWGKFRPYLLFGTPVLGILLVLTFTTPNFGSGGKLLYAYLTYISLGVVYTVVNLPYGALASTMTQEPDDRNALSAYRSFFARAGDGLFVGLATPALVMALGRGNHAQGFQLTAVIYALLGSAALWFTFSTCHERYVASGHVKLSIPQVVAALRHNGPFFLLMVSFLFFVSAAFTRNSASVYYMTYNVQRPELLGPLLASGTIASLIGIPFSQPLARRIGKRNTFIVGLAGWALSGVAMYLTPYVAVQLLFACYSIGYIAFGLSFGLFWSLISDTVEYSEWKTGVRAEGGIYSIASFLMKLCSAMAGIAPAMVLSLSGYVPNTAQSETALNGINWIMTVLPAVFGVMAITPLMLYRLDEALFARIVADLRRRRSAAHDGTSVRGRANAA
jgi:sugar (glycoside-pentoside-hexuronide) transporter